MAASSFDLPTSSPGQINLIVASTGSVATIKIPILLHRLARTGHYNIVYLPSHTALTFHQRQCHDSPDTSSPTETELSDIPASVTVLTDAQEWSSWQRGSEILHISLRRWADVLLLAPLSAHTMAKCVAGLSDSLLLEVLRAWDYPVPPSLTITIDGSTEQGGSDGGHDDGEKHDTTKSVWVKRLCCAPAMNTAMYTHPFTARHVRTMKETLGFTVLGPIEKTLACGDVGTGAMVEVDTLVDWLEHVWVEFTTTTTTTTTG